jgi:hypothetical protein
MTHRVETQPCILLGIGLILALFPSYSRASSPAAPSPAAKRAAAAPRRDPPSPLPSGTEGPIESAEVETKVYDPNNPNVVVATEWVKLEYSVTYEWIDSGVTTSVSDRSTVWLDCTNECQGKKHKNHDECDTSCDKLCAKRHRLTMRGRYEPLYANMRQAEKDANKAARASGLGDDVREWVTSYTSNQLQEAKKEAEKVVTADIDHWAGACVHGMRAYGLHRYDFKITGKFTRFIRRKQMGVVTERTEPGATHNKVVAYIWLPDTSHPIKEDNQVRCKCFKEPPADPVVEFGCPPPPIVDFPVPGETPKLNDAPKPKDPPKPNRTPTFSGLGVRDSNGNLNLSLFSPYLKVSLAANGVDLNQVAVTIDNQSDHACTCEFTAGMMCVADDSKYQSTACVSNRKFTIPAHMRETCMIPVMCTDIDRKEPDSHCTFSLGECVDQGLTNCCRLVNSSRGRGAKDQARIWILENQATLDRINMRLFPGVTPGNYLNALHDVAQIGCVDMTDPRFRQCLDPKLLLGSSATPEATAWLIHTLENNDPDQLANFLAADRKEYSVSRAKEDFKPAEIQHVADIAKALCSSTRSETRQQGLKFLREKAPPQIRQEVAQAGGLDMALEQLTSTDPKEALSALGVVESYAYKPAADTLKSLAKHGANDAIKQKAADVLATLK